VLETLQFLSFLLFKNETVGALNLGYTRTPIYSGPSSYDRLDIRTTWVKTKILFLTYDQILSYDPHAGQGHLSYELRPAWRS
jgi:hypothetical protein